MPYVPSEKTVPPALDRKILDPLVEIVAKKAAGDIKENEDLIPVYRKIFVAVGGFLEQLINENGKCPIVLEAEEKLALAIYELRKKYAYDGAEDGELNYSITRFIQRVPQIKVERKEWPDKDELRYWSYVRACHALIAAALHFKDSDLGLMGVYIDIKDEYKWKVNRAYEAAQIVKSGDCYDTPYYSRLVEVVDAFGNHVGHMDVLLKRSEETLHKDVLNGQIVLQLRIAETIKSFVKRPKRKNK